MTLHPNKLARQKSAGTNPQHTEDIQGVTLNDVPTEHWGWDAHTATAAGHNRTHSPDAYRPRAPARRFVDTTYTCSRGYDARASTDGREYTGALPRPGAQALRRRTRRL